MSHIMDKQETTLETYLPQVRCDQELKRRLERVARASISSRLSDHVRVAVEQYVISQERVLGVQQN
ncbi:MAG: ribbon-helix-helix protein, CopG family [Nitrospiraceae bacterium]